MPRRAIFCLLLAAGCGTPGSKNASPNNASTNSSTNSSTNASSNNGSSNSSTNNTGGTNSGTTRTSGGPLIAAADYDQSCLYNDQCGPVFEGDVCENCGCANAAVSTAAAEQYRTDLAGLSVDCPVNERCMLIDCAEALTICSAGSCGIRQPVFVSAGAFDRQCETAADCVGIFEGEVCQPCQCTNAAVAHDSLEAVMAVREGVDCGSMLPVSCAECQPTTMACNAGQCEAVAE